MRKINIMLVAALAASPLALASGGGHHGGYDDLDLTIEGSGNDSYYKDIEISKSKNIALDNVGNEDNDELKLENVGNTYTKLDEDNSVYTETYELDLDKDINLYLSKTKLDGYVMDTSVTYGGACCKGSASDITVYHDNQMANSFSDAAGVNLSGQNAGNNSLVQQTSSTNAALVGSN